MTGSIYKNGIFYGEPNMSVKYYDNPQDYYDLPIEEREAMTELVILNDDDNPLDASLITYKDGSVADALDEMIIIRHYSLDDTASGTIYNFNPYRAVQGYKQIALVNFIDNYGYWFMYKTTVQNGAWSAVARNLVNTDKRISFEFDIIYVKDY